MFEKLKYKRYCAGKMKIRRRLSPDHMAECIDIGHVRNIKFKSENTYRMRLTKVEWDPASDSSAPLYDGIYEMTNDIQPLTFDQFIQLTK